MKRRNFIKITLPVALTGYAGAQTSADKPTLSFGVIADPQYADIPPTGSRHYRNSIAKMEAAIEELNKHPLDFVVTLGDVIDRDLKSFKTMMPLYEKLKAPRRFVLGNHDFEVAANEKDQVLSEMMMKKAYDSEIMGDWHFIYLDGNDVCTYRYPKDSLQTKSAEQMRLQFERQKRPQSQAWNGALGEAQMKWLEDELKLAKKNSKRVIVFNHFPAFPLNSPHNIWNDGEIVKLLTSFPNVIAYMNGHNHQGHYAAHEGCHYVTFKGMVETQTINAFGIVRCYPDRVEIEGSGAEPDRKLS